MLREPFAWSSVPPGWYYRLFAFVFCPEALCWAFPRWSRRPGFEPWVRKIPCRRKWQPTLVFLPEKSHGQRSLVGFSPWGCKRVGPDLATKQQQIKLNLFGSFLIEGSGWMLKRQSFSPKSVHKLRNNVPEHKMKGLLCVCVCEFWWNSPGNDEYIQPLGTDWATGYPLFL